MTDQTREPNATNAVCDTPKHWPGVLGVPDYEPWLDGDPLQGGRRWHWLTAQVLPAIVGRIVLIEQACHSLADRVVAATDAGNLQIIADLGAQVRALRGELARVSLDRDLYDRVLGLQKRLDDLEQRLSVGYAGPGDEVRKLLSEDELREILSDDPGQQSPVARLVAAREGVLVAVANLVEWAWLSLQPGDVLSVPPGSPMRGLLWRLCGAWQTYAALSGRGRPPQGGTHA